MTTLYIYNTEDNTLVARIEGSSNEACEAVASEQYGDSFGWTYSPAFGFGGIDPGDNVVDIAA